MKTMLLTLMLLIIIKMKTILIKIKLSIWKIEAMLDNRKLKALEKDFPEELKNLFDE